MEVLLRTVGSFQMLWHRHVENFIKAENKSSRRMENKKLYCDKFE